MGIDNVISEELSRMKSLFKYEKGKVISEQGNMTGTAGVGMSGPFMPSPSSPAPAQEEKGWWENHPALLKFIKNQGAKNVHYPPASAKKGGTIAIQMDDEFWVFVPDNNIWRQYKKWEDAASRTPNFVFDGNWSENGDILIIKASDGDTYSTATHNWSGVPKDKGTTGAPGGSTTVGAPGGGTTVGAPGGAPGKGTTVGAPGGGNKSSCSVPSELKDIEGIKKFQDWCDKNHAGWAYGYANGILNKLGKGYGRMGPRTCKAWSLYKDEYLKSLQPTEKPEVSGEVTSVNANSEVGGEQGNTVPNAGATQTQTKTQVSGSEF
jgi:hypothetical protein